MTSDVVLEVHNLNKHFGPTYANKNVNLSVRRGEVRGIAGENGCGKSTLLSQIAGIYTKDSGDMILNGKPYDPHSPQDAMAMRVATVVQELGVVNNLSAATNVFMGSFDRFKRFGIISLKMMYKEIEAIEAKWGIPPIPLKSLCSGMHVEQRKMIELVRALSIDPAILILDEMTQALSVNNREKLYNVIAKFKEEGRTILMISHDIDELVALADTVTVMRDGEVVDTVSSADTSVDVIKSMMIGRKLDGEYYRNDTAPSRKEEKVLAVEHLIVPNIVNDVSFDVYSGEIVAFCGLSDSGIREVGKCLFGLMDTAQGSVKLICDNREMQVRNPGMCLKNRVAYLPKERDGEGLMMQASIEDNLTLTSLDELKNKIGYLSPQKLAEASEEAVENYNIRCTSISQKVGRLSGGNKQKVNLGRWLMKDLRLLILDCPTRGVDIGVKAYIYDVMKKAKDNGLAIVLISDELPEALGMADRLLVFKNGRLVREIPRGADFTEEKVIEVMV